MDKFKKLAFDTRSNTEFLIDHGINPALIAPRTALYDPSTKGLIKVIGPTKDSPYFTQNSKDNPERKIFDNDSLKIIDVEETYIPKDDMNQPGGNFYVQNTTGEPRVITVNEFMDTIYNHPKNEMLILDLMKHNDDLELDTPEKKATIKQDYNQKLDTKIAKAKAEFEKWVDDNEYLLELDGATEKARKEALVKLYKKWKEGFAVKDLVNLPYGWEAVHSIPLDIYKKKINSLKDKDEKENLKFAFQKQIKDWFKTNKETKEFDTDRAVLKAANQWWKEMTSKKEEVLDEKSDAVKPGTRDPHLIKDIYLPKLGIDPKFYTVPMTSPSAYNHEKYKSAKDDPNAKRGFQFTIVGIPDVRKLSDEDTLWVKKYNSDERPFQMNIGEIKELAALPKNIDATLDTVKHRTFDLRNAHRTLNAGIGKFEVLPDEVIEEMLKTVNQEYPEDFPVDLVQYYRDSQGKDFKSEKEGQGDLVLRALRRYNSEDCQNYVIERFNNKGKVGYRGFIPHEGYEKVTIHRGGHDNEFHKFMGF